MVSTKREQLDRLLKLYRHGRITEEILLDQIEEVVEDCAADVDEVSDGASQTDAGDPAAAGRADSLIAMVALLDQFRAAERSGAETLSRWAGLTSDPGLVGGLRVVAARENTHALLLEERIRELGEAPTAEIPSWLAGFNRALASHDATDLERLGALVAQFSDVRRAVKPLEDAILLADDDELTREVLRAILDDEVATIEWFRAAYATRSTE
jgi:hypothetical protein